MKKSFITTRHRHSRWLLLAAIMLLSIPSCNTEKKVTKKLMKLDEKKLNDIRPWPYNYTYYDYVEKLDNAKIRQQFYLKRGLQAKIADDERTEKIMKDNVDNYQKIIDRLEKDKKYHKIYKLREREIQVKINKEQKVQKEIAQQKAIVDKEAIQRANQINKQRDLLIKKRQQQLSDKKKRLEGEKKEFERELKTNSHELKQRRKQISQLEAISRESVNTDETNFEEDLERLYSEVEQLEIEKQETEKDIVAKNSEIEIFIKDYYTQSDSIIESQMVFSLDSFPQQTKKGINIAIDSIP